MYVGRIVAVGRNPEGRLAVLYRVSSRSFPNRQARVSGQAVSIVPKPGSESDVLKNPYIAYNCLRVVGETAIATNGAQTDPIAEKVQAGVPLRDALAWTLLVLDYEKDQYQTPRIAAAVRRGEAAGFLGVIRQDGLEVRRMPLAQGECAFVSTYETNVLSPAQRCEFPVASAGEGAEFIMGGGAFGGMTHPVTAACALETGEGFEVAVAPQ